MATKIRSWSILLQRPTIFAGEFLDLHRLECETSALARRLLNLVASPHMGHLLQEVHVERV